MISPATLRLRVKTLPSLPSTVVALGEAVNDERCSVDRVLGILSKDPSISAALLRLANSAFYAGDEQVRDLRTAVVRMGFEAVLNLGRSAAVIRAFKDAKNLDPMRLWQHSVAVGLVAKGICRMTGNQARSETAFLAGLLHDVGKIALDRCFPEEYAPVVAAIAEGGVGLDLELELVGITHAEVGGILAAQWNFPDDLVQVIRHHHAPEAGDYLSSLIFLCDLLVRTRIPNGPADENISFVLSELPACREVFGTRDLDLEHLTFSIDDELDHATSFVQMAFQD